MFPFGPNISIAADLNIHYQLVLKNLGPLLTEERKRKIQQVVMHRNFSNAVVLEGIYDRGNVSAVVRSAEALGFANIHLVETQARFKEANRVTKGSDKWVEMQRWPSTNECIKYLKSNAYKIVVTSLESSKSISEVNFCEKTALVLGNEKDGVSKEMSAAADERIIIPMSGFVQSFNISVAGAISLYHIFHDRFSKLGPHHQDLDDEQQEILKAHYYLRTQESGYDYLRELYNRGKILS